MIKTLKNLLKQDKETIHRPPESAGCDPRPPDLEGRYFYDWRKVCQDV